ncbi:component of 5-methylcytosine-specific restriction enzyme McrBC [Hydrogenivirga sp. 128-5-R1-1]|nr:component of 5-methylcytosine-specific restriction enzyme McrBC [Hydrogenivirga sp. 128-5-R1-1]
MQLHPGDEGSSYTPEKIKAILNAHKVIGFDIWDEPLKGSELEDFIDKPFTEWKDEDVAQAIELAKSAGSEGTFGIIKDFRDRMRMGDIVLIRKGRIPIALVKVISDYFFNSFKDEDGEPWFRHRRRVEVLSYFDEDKEKLGLSFNSVRIGGQTKTLQILVNPGAIKGIIEEWLRKMELRNLKKKIREALEHQKQIILYGPPGTGKTFTAKQVTKDLILNGTNVRSIIDKHWDNFVDYLHGKTLTTKQGEYFSCEKTRENSIKAVNKSINVTKDSFTDFISKCWPDIENYSLQRGESYHWSVALKFRECYLNQYIKLIQFHPSYTYEDFVRGIQVEIQNGIPVYRTVNRIFAEMCERALNEPNKNFVLIIDEINRANLPAVLGELIYALEYRGEPVETPYEVNGSRTLIVPDNLYIIGTMNTADRSIGHIDYALRRRFYFLPVIANKDEIENPKARELYQNTIEKIFTEENMSPEFRDKVEDVKIGHTYFLGTNNEIAHKLVYQVIPLLIEYIQDGILKDEEVVKNVMDEYFKGVANWRQLTTEAVMNKLQFQT